MKEQGIQRQIIEYLTLIGWFVIKNNTVGVWKEKTKHYIPSQAKGLADLTIIKDGNVVMIEVKAKYGKQSENQIEFQKSWEDHGGKYLLVKSIDDVIALLNVE